MKIYATYKSEHSGSYWLYELRRGCDCFFWMVIAICSINKLKELDSPVFLLRRNGGQVQKGDMEELCEFSPP